MCFLFLDPQDEVGPSISSSVVLCSSVLLVYIVVLVLVVCLCPSSVRVLATFSGTVLFPLLCSVLPFTVYNYHYTEFPSSFNSRIIILESTEPKTMEISSQIYHKKLSVG